MHFLPLFSEDYLLNKYAEEFDAYVAAGADDTIRERLRAWAERDPNLTEANLQSGLLVRFFRELWRYTGSGEADSRQYTLAPQHPVPRAGAGGSTGFADLALGFFEPDSPNCIPQVIAEFKDIRSGLDSPQRRKENPRTPVKQMFDYLRAANDLTDPHSPVRPTWGIVTDMNEFRLYYRPHGESQCQRFIIRKLSGDPGPSLIDEGEAGAAQRFLFSLMFSADLLLADGRKSRLEQILEHQRNQERDLEEAFYDHYSSFRKNTYSTLVRENPALRKTTVLRMTQRIIDRFIFLLFCEDMGERLRFPPDLIRDLLAHASTSPYFDQQGVDVWSQLKRLFSVMESGGRFADKVVPCFNGGLFAADDALETLRVPNSIFCARGQGASSEAIEAAPGNLLHLSACYNFGEKGVPRRRTIGLHTLGRIFEQSITDLEVMEAEAEGRTPSRRISKRKRDGVYYTPEWVTAKVVEETIGRKMEDIKQAIGLPDPSTIADEEVSKWRKAGVRAKAKTHAGAYLRQLEGYATEIEQLTVLDVACGSGAFLIQALQRLLQERRWIAAERERIDPERLVFDYDESIRATLSNNLYGVDINTESIEITKLALWLRTAQADAPLTALDHNIRAGNSLADTSFKAYFEQEQMALFEAEPEERREQIAIFDWSRAFPEVFARGGFDCIVGNPPYVKFQNLRAVDAVFAEYLRSATDTDGRRIYESTSSGNFDLYIPFIEKGLRLLNDSGRMGIIAPNLWIKQAYGKHLRELIAAGRNLERWIDFGDFQVFKDATTYTALQFYTKTRNDGIQYVELPTVNLGEALWDTSTAALLDYESLPSSGPWTFIEPQALGLITRLQEQHPSLGDSVKSISVGVQTSADSVFHFEEVGSGKYRNDHGTFEFGDFMRPLVSGEDVDRYAAPDPARRILFPYVVTEAGDGGKAKVELASPAEIRRRAPAVWRYLNAHAAALKGRERNKFDDEHWYRFGRNQNIDKQHLTKVLIPRLVQHLGATPDIEGEYVADNVDVCYLIPLTKDDVWYLVGILNCHVVDFVFRSISKPFRGSYRSANKQYIAPIPIPAPSAQQKQAVSELAKELWSTTTARQEKCAQIDRALASGQVRRVERDPAWLWADLRTPEHWIGCAPSDLRSKSSRRKWAREHRAALLDAHIASWELMTMRQPLIVVCDGEELQIVDARAEFVHAGIFVDDEQPEFVAAQWRRALSGRTMNGPGLQSVLTSYRVTQSASLRERVIRLDAEIAELDAEIHATNASLDALAAELYGLSEAERALVADRR